MAAALCAFLAGAGVWFGSGTVRAAGKTAENAPGRITVDYPLEGSLFPPEITAPTFLWHDPEAGATRWVVEVSVAGQTALRFEAAGEHLQQGRMDEKAGPGVDLTPEQAATRTWKPDAGAWEQIKRLAAKGPARVTIRGFADGDGREAVSEGRVTISTSTDRVGAPIFYRDVPLMVSPTEHGQIAPLPQFAIPLIKWQIRNIAEPESHMVMGNLPTCANCHSFSADGKTMGLDMDGPRNDKGLYALVPVEKQITIGNKDLIRWSSFQVDKAARSDAPTVKRFGFMSQVSPDGRYVVTSIAAPAAAHTTKNAVQGFAPGLSDRLYNTNYMDLAFNQVFFPTRGILAWYDRREQKMRPLPGADDPNYVQTSAFWSPDGKFLIFSRAAARDPYPASGKKPQHANDPEETQIQYDLYKIPFNEGRGGKAEPVAGAANNGMSNDFPKVSPDGKWIVWVENKNGLLMRPDSRLFIVPFNGGQARLMRCNTRLMNSWHSFSPNGRWLAFSSKGRGPFTQLMLTHIDRNGNDSPAILVENTTAANRAVNIPEFVNVPPGGLETIDPQALEFYKMVEEAFHLAEKNRVPEAIGKMQEALERNPDDAMAHYNLGLLLEGGGQKAASLAEFRRAEELGPENALFPEHLAVALVVSGQVDAGVAELRKALVLRPDSAEDWFNLGYILERQKDFAGALEPLKKAVELSEGKNWQYLGELASTYDRTGQEAEAIAAAGKALDLAVAAGDGEAARGLREALERYRTGRQ